MKHKFLLFISSALLLSALPAFAQMVSMDIVTTSAVVKTPAVKPGSSGVLVVNVKIAPGYHINVEKPADESLIPTTFSADAVTGVRFAPAHFLAAKSIRVSYSKTPMLVYENTTTIVVPFQVSKSAHPGKVDLKGEVNYQGCNAVSCLPPNSAPVHAWVTIK